MKTYLVLDTVKQKVRLVTRSAREARDWLGPGCKSRIDVWDDNTGLEDTIYYKTIDKMKPYIDAEKEYHRRKQKAAEQRNRRKKKHEH